MNAIITIKDGIITLDIIRAGLNEAQSLSAMPQQQKRRRRRPSGNKEDPALVAEATAWARTRRTVSIRGLQRALQLGYPRATAVMKELEQNQVVSLVGTNGLRTMLPAPTEIPKAPSNEFTPSEATLSPHSSLQAVPRDERSSKAGFSQSSPDDPEKNGTAIKVSIQVAVVSSGGEAIP